jgi:hypothetical protein
MASGGKITTLYGGVPVLVDSQVIGGVGVGGGSGEQDAQIARAGIQAFSDQLVASHPGLNKEASPAVEDAKSKPGERDGSVPKRDDSSTESLRRITPSCGFRQGIGAEGGNEAWGIPGGGILATCR